MQATQVHKLSQFLRSTCANPAAGTTTALSSGNNTISVPSGHDLVLIVPKPDEAATLKVKGANGDTGVTISSVYPTLLTITAGSLVVNASTGADVELVFGKTATA